jgi:hypothetical protein
MAAETEIVSDAPSSRLKRRGAKKARAACVEASAVAVFEAEPESVEPAACVARAGEERVRREPDGEVRELVVERMVPNPRMVLGSYWDGEEKRVVKVWVGSNKNFKVRMRLKAQRGEAEGAPWRLIGRRPRLPGRW